MAQQTGCIAGKECHKILEYETKAPSKTWNRECARHDLCDYKGENGPTEQSKKPTKTSSRE